MLDKTEHLSFIRDVINLCITFSPLLLGAFPSKESSTYIHPETTWIFRPKSHTQGQHHPLENITSVCFSAGCMWTWLKQLKGFFFCEKSNCPSSFVVNVLLKYIVPLKLNILFPVQKDYLLELNWTKWLVLNFHNLLKIDGFIT